MKTKLKCIHCGTEIEETDCTDLSIEGDYIIAEKVGECPNCEAEYWWNEQYVYKKSFDLTLI